MSTEARIKVERFMYDGLFDLERASSHFLSAISESFRARYEDPCGVSSIYLRSAVSIEFNRSVEFNVRESDSYSIDDWEIQRIGVGAVDLKCVYTIRHLHLRSKLSCATLCVGRLKWECGTCGVAVPTGVLWAARTQAIRRAT